MKVNRILVRADLAMEPAGELRRPTLVLDLRKTLRIDEGEGASLVLSSWNSRQDWILLPEVHAGYNDRDSADYFS